jgi:hypothetical protein
LPETEDVLAEYDELDAVGSAYVEHLSDTDLRTLVGADGVTVEEQDRRVQALRRQPALVLDVLARPATVDALLNLAGTTGRRSERLTFVSPFLVFAAAVHRTAADLGQTYYTTERSGPRLRVPVFDSADLAAYLALARRRLFLTDLLASFTRVSSGVAWTKTSGGWQRRRWNELDPLRLAALLDAVPEDQKPGVWRRMGDLALFLTGVFPDRATPSGPFDSNRLARLTGLSRPPEDDDPLDLLERFGARWYLIAAERALAQTSTTAELRDAAEHFHQARRVLNAVTDRYLFPLSNDWFRPPS